VVEDDGRRHHVLTGVHAAPAVALPDLVLRVEHRGQGSGPAGGTHAQYGLLFSDRLNRDGTGAGQAHTGGPGVRARFLPDGIE
jgi:hypothetical protein